MPGSELEKIVKYLFIVRVECMGTIGLYEDAVFIIAVVYIPTDVRAFFNDENWGM